MTFAKKTDAEKTLACPLCSNTKLLNPYHQDKTRTYFQCGNCALVFVPEHEHLSESKEKSEYDKHENDLEDEGYLRFLSRTYLPLLDRLPIQSTGLDFGCGPAPALARQLEKAGHCMSIFDKYYFPDPKPLEKTYDFVVSTEVVEHVAAAAELWNVFDSLLTQQGLLAIMTKRVKDQEAFKKWHYKNDPTHICFYSEATFNWIAKKHNWTLDVIDQDVVFFNKAP